MASGGKKVIGVGNSTGEYQGFKYNNVILHLVYDDDDVAGQAVQRVKVKSQVYNLYPVAIGDIVDFNYDAYSKVKEIVKI